MIIELWILNTKKLSSLSRDIMRTFNSEEDNLHFELAPKPGVSGEHVRTYILLLAPSTNCMYSPLLIIPSYGQVPVGRQPREYATGLFLL